MPLALRLVIDEILDPHRPVTGAAAAQLARALVETAPAGTVVEGIVSASTEDEYRELEERVPGLAGLDKSALARRELTALWRSSLASAPSGMLHSPSLLAPLGRHDRIHEPGTQAAVTLLDAHVWTEPETISGRSLAWQRAMVRRAEKYADALVVPSHAVAAQVAEHANFGDRVRVIPHATADGLTIPRDVLERLSRLELPSSYVLTFAAANPRHQLAELLTALETLDVPLVIAGERDPESAAVGELITASGIPTDRVIRLGYLDSAHLAAVQAGAAVFVQPSRDEGFGMSVLEAFTLGTPVVISDAPALVELAADTALIVERGAGFADGLQQAIGTVLGDSTLAERLRVAGRDRARLFSWRDSAEKVWQLHANL